MRTKRQRKTTSTTPPPGDDAPLTTANSVAHEGTRVGPVVVDGCKHLSPFDLLRYELSQIRVVSANQAIGLKILTIQRTKDEAEAAIRKMQSELDGMRAEMKARQDELTALQTELTGLYGLDFQQVTYDDASGKLYVLGEPVAE